MPNDRDPKDSISIDISSFIAPTTTSYQRAKFLTGKRRVRVSSSGRILDPKSKPPATNRPDWRSYSISKGKAATKNKPVLGRPVASQSRLRRGEYLVPSKNDKSKALVKRLPYDQILHTLDEIPATQRNLITPTLNAMVENAEIRFPTNQLDDDGRVIEQVIKGEAMVLLVCQNAAHKNKLLSKFVHSYELLHEAPINFDDENAPKWRKPTWEEICHYAGITASEFLGAFTSAAHDYGMQQAKIVIDLSMSRVIRAAVDQAVEGGKDGYRDRELILKAGEVIRDTGNGPTVNINNNNNSLTLAGSNQGLPSWDEHLKVLSGVSDAVEGEIVEEHTND